MKGVVAALTMVLGAIVASATAAASVDQTTFFIGAGPHQGTRASDGTVALSISASNLTNSVVEVSLESAGCNPRLTTGGPRLEPYTTGAIIEFSMSSCRTGSAAMRGTLMAAVVNGEASTVITPEITPNPASIEINFTLTDQAKVSDWTPLGRGFLLGAFLAWVAVVPPYLVWVRWPMGNARGPAKEAKKRVKQDTDVYVKTAKLKAEEAEKKAKEANAAAKAAAPTEAATAKTVADDARSEADRLRGLALAMAERQALAVEAQKAWDQTKSASLLAGNDSLTAVVQANEARDMVLSRGSAVQGSWIKALRTCLPKLGTDLPGFPSDWTLKDNWVTNISLVVALFTGVFASSNILEALLGEVTTASLPVIAVAAALSVGAIGAGPIFLTIGKRRWTDRDGVASYDTVGGVLAAALVGLVGSFGLIMTTALQLDNDWAWALAVVTLVILLVYSWKSIPQTLALGANRQAGIGKRTGSPML